MPGNLNKGFAIIIDNLLPSSAVPEELISPANKADDIFKIITQIETLGIPISIFNKIPPDKIIEHFDSLNFILLDWMLYDEKITNLPDGVVKSNEAKNIAFIKKIKEKCFCPIFIFSTEAKEDIIPVLKEAQLYDSENDERNFIFIKQKGELVKENNLLNIIDDWVKNHPAIYVLKKWENRFSKAKNENFWNLFEKSPLWPVMLWRTSEKDLGEPNSDINEIIFKNVRARFQGDVLTKAIIDKPREAKFNIKEMMSVIRGTMFIDEKFLTNKEEIKPGDIYLDSTKYYINIRPECDTVNGRHDGFVYLLKGKAIDEKEIVSRYEEPYGLKERHVDSIILGLDEEIAVKFRFKDLSIRKITEIKGKRIYRLIPPYSTNLQQRFNSYFGRIGIPRYPDEIIQEMKKELEQTLPKE